MKYLIIGTGRSGTGYMSKLLTAAGIPCGHEDFFHPHHKPSPTDYRSVRAESSWLALEYSWATRGRKVIHALRDPLRVWESLMRIGFFAGTNPGHRPYEEAAYRMAPGVKLKPTQGHRAAKWMDCVYRTVLAMNVPVTTVKVDRLTRKQLQNLLNIDKGAALYAMSQVPTNYNSRGKAPVECPVPELVTKWRERFGYQED